MGYFKEMEIEIIDMFHSNGIKEAEIAKILGVSLTQVTEVLDAYDRQCDADADEGEIVSYDDLLDVNWDGHHDD